VLAGFEPVAINVTLTVIVPRHRSFLILNEEIVRNHRATQTWHAGCEGIGIFFRERERGTRTVSGDGDGRACSVALFFGGFLIGLCDG
jgi:hypothetical protein